MTMQLRLAEDVFFCVAQGYGVFLDLKRDAYSAIDLKGDAFDRDDRFEDGIVRLTQSLSAHADALIGSGLLIQDGPGRPLEASPKIAPARNHVCGAHGARAFGGWGVDRADSSLSLKDVRDVLLSARTASRGLKTKPIRAIVHSVRRRKANAGKPSCDLEDLRTHVILFQRLRPWYPRDYLCLFDSLALLEFLFRRNFFPDWVFAVQMLPFGAHCWLQFGDSLLNESVEYAGRFTPLMAV